MKKIMYLGILVIMLLGGIFAYKKTGYSNEDAPLSSKDVEDPKITSDESELRTYKQESDTERVKEPSGRLSSKIENKEMEASRTKQILEQVIPDGEASRRVDSAEKSFFESSQTVESVQVETEIYNSIYDEGIYDNLKSQDLTFNKVECRKAGCKLEFKLGNSADEKTLSKKRLIIFAELRRLEKLKDKQAVSNTDNNTIHYYYY